MSFTNARNAYMTAQVQTTTPAQLLVMLYDGLLRNLDVADAALSRGDLPAAHTGLIKAQAIVTELDVSLDTSAWPAGKALQQLYRFIDSELIEANLTKEVGRVRACRELIAPLAQAWRQAATSGSVQPAQPAVHTAV